MPAPMNRQPNVKVVNRWDQKFKNVNDLVVVTKNMSASVPKRQRKAKSLNICIQKKLMYF
jgi:hypothetical protein